MQLLATATFVLHTLWVSFILGMIPLIIVGHQQGWRWIRNSWLRTVHVAVMGFVIVETLFKLPCPLTLLENYARTQSGDLSYSNDGFVMDWFEKLIGMRPPSYAFDAFYYLLFALIVALFWAVPPNSSRRKFSAAHS